jgi:hypothetical protein
MYQLYCQLMEFDKICSEIVSTEYIFYSSKQHYPIRNVFYLD